MIHLAKMSKAQARKRLNEASVKMMAVYLAALEGKLGAVNTRQITKLNGMALELRKIVETLK